MCFLVVHTFFSISYNSLLVWIFHDCFLLQSIFHAYTSTVKWKMKTVLKPISQKFVHRLCVLASSSLMVLDNVALIAPLA